MLIQPNSSHANALAHSPRAENSTERHVCGHDSWFSVSARQAAKTVGAMALLLSPAAALAAPQASSTYLVPKNAFNKSGFMILDIRGEGVPAVIDNRLGSNTTIFDVKTDGQVIASATAGSTPVCLDVKGARYANETTVLGWECTGRDNQKWNFTDADAGESPQFWTLSPVGQPEHMHYCLDVAHRGNTSGTPVQIYPCNGGDNQKWTLISAG